VDAQEEGEVKGVLELGYGQIDQVLLSMGTAKVNLVSCWIGIPPGLRDINGGP
jgi:hypothetical protein